MKMETGGFITELVSEMESDLLADIDIQSWGRPLPIDGDDGPRL